MINSTGNIFTLATFGESHGDAIGGVIDGMPAGVCVDLDRIQAELARRRPGTSAVVSRRSEADEVRLLSGIFEGCTTGAPIGFVIENTDVRTADYSDLRDVYRPNHADYTYMAKFGLRDYRGGGRASARETASRVVGGALAMQALECEGIEVVAYASAIGGVVCEARPADVSDDAVWANAVRCPDAAGADAMYRAVQAAAADGDSLGGVVTCVVRGAPAGLGEPVFSRLESMLGAAIMSIPAVKGFDVGLGVESARVRGSQIRDEFYRGADGRIATRSNHSGGIQGGISNGMPIVMRAYFKPTPTIMRPFRTINSAGEEVEVSARGRHDPCVVPRAVPVVRAMAAMTVLDALLLDRTRRIKH